MLFILAHSQGVLESGFIIFKYYPEFIPLKQVHNIGELRSSDSFKSVEGSVSWVGAFGNDPIRVVRCPRILAIKSRPAKWSSILLFLMVRTKRPYLSFVGLAINRGIWDTSFASLQVLKDQLWHTPHIGEQSLTYPYSPPFSLRKVVQNHSSAWNVKVRMIVK